LIGDTKNLLANITMPKTKSDCNANNYAKPPNKDANDALNLLKLTPQVAMVG
jgi:hypothetical protein